MTARPYITPARLRDASQRADRVTGWIMLAVLAIGAAAVALMLAMVAVTICGAINTAPLNLMGLGG